MAEQNITKHQKTIYFSDNEVNIIKNHKTKHHISNDTEALRNIINTFDPIKELRKNKLVYLIYPAILTILLFVVSQSMYNVYNTTLQQGVPFKTLFDMGQVFMILGVGALTWFLLNLFIFRDKVLGKGQRKL